MDYIFADRMGSLKASAIREILKHTSGGNVIPFSAGNPSPETFPVPEMQKIADEIFSSCAADALQYGITEGYTPLRDYTKKRISEKFDAFKENDELIITSGGQQGIELACKVLVNEGDTVLCEDPSFIGGLNAIRSYGANLVGIPMEDDGMDMAALENALKTEKNVKLIYTIPTFHNPTGITMSDEKKEKLYNLAAEYNVIIIEDNPYGELSFDGSSYKTVKSFDKKGVVIYSGSFSKVLAAGIRVGFVCGPAQIISKMVVAKQVSDVHTNLFFQILAYRYFTEYDFEEHLKFNRSIYSEKCALMLEGLSKYGNGKVKYTIPRGGLFLWGTAPEGTDIAALAKKAVEKGVAIVPGVAFAVDMEKPVSAFRLNYSTPSLSQIEEGTKILSEVLNEFIK